MKLGTLAYSLTIAFVVLKLAGIIDWSWFWVLFPAIAMESIALALIVTAEYQERRIRKRVEDLLGKDIFRK